MFESCCFAYLIQIFSWLRQQNKFDPCYYITPVYTAGHNKGQKWYVPKAEDIKKRWQEYTELYKKDLNDPDNHDGMITHLEPDILESEVKWALGIIITDKAIGGGGIPADLFQVLKDGAVEVLPSTCQPIWKTQQWPQD